MGFNIYSRWNWYHILLKGGCYVAGLGYARINESPVAALPQRYARRAMAWCACNQPLGNCFNVRAHTAASGRPKPNPTAASHPCTVGRRPDWRSSPAERPPDAALSLPPSVLLVSLPGGGGCGVVPGTGSGLGAGSSAADDPTVPGCDIVSGSAAGGGAGGPCATAPSADGAAVGLGIAGAPADTGGA